MNTYKLTVIFSDYDGKQKKHFTVKASCENDAENIVFDSLTAEGFDPIDGVKFLIKKAEE